MKRCLALLLLHCLLFIRPALAEDQSVQFDLRHGNAQVEQMLSDLPNMAQYTTSNGKLAKVRIEDSIWRWATTNFGRKVNSTFIEWSGQHVEKPIQYLGDHKIPVNGSNALVLIRKTFKDEKGHTRNATFNELWAACVFELINIQNAATFMDSYNRAIKGELSREAWINLNTQPEHKALLRLKAFCQETWIPWSEQKNHKYEITAWGLDTPDDYDKWIQMYEKSPSNPYQYWGDYYDSMIVPYLKELRKWKQSNKPTAGNVGIAPQLTIGHFRPGVPEPER
jgi:hypothetical protein